MLPAAGGNIPLVVVFNASLVVMAVVQLIVALSLANLVARSEGKYEIYLRLFSPGQS